MRLGGNESHELSRLPATKPMGEVVESMDDESKNRRKVRVLKNLEKKSKKGSSAPKKIKKKI